METEYTGPKAKNIGEMILQKGYTEKSLMVYGWDVADKCAGKKCLCLKFCKYYDKIKDQKDPKCMVQSKYMSEVMRAAFDIYENDMTPAQMHHVGMLLMPLYKILCKIKMRELSLNDTDYENKNKTRFINPLYKEMRGLISSIDNLWKSIDLKAKEIVSENIDSAIELDFGSDGFYKKVKEVKDTGIEPEDTLVKPEETLSEKVEDIEEKLSMLDDY